MKQILRKYSTKWKTGILQAFVAIFLLTSSACDFDIPEKFEMPTWFLDIKIPLVQKRYEMGDLSNPDYNIYQNFMIASSAGFIASSSTQPLDYFKTIVQSSKNKELTTCKKR